MVSRQNTILEAGLVNEGWGVVGLRDGRPRRAVAANMFQLRANLLGAESSRETFLSSELLVRLDSSGVILC